MKNILHDYPQRAYFVIPALIYSFYSWFTYTGLYRWLAESMMNFFGSYLVILTGMLCIGICLVASLIPVYVLIFLKVFKKKPPVANEEKERKIQERISFIYAHQYWLVFVVVSVGLVLAGLFCHTRTFFYGPHTRWDFSKEKAPSSYFVTFIAPAPTHPPFIMTTRVKSGSIIKTYYYPFLSSNTQYRSVVFVETTARHAAFTSLESGLDVMIEGTLTQNTLPGIIREETKKMGYGDDYYVLLAGNSPTQVRTMGSSFLFCGIFIGLICYLYYFKKIRIKNIP